MAEKFGLKCKIEDTGYNFSTKQLHLLILCTFSRFGETGFRESITEHPAIST